MKKYLLVIILISVKMAFSQNLKKVETYYDRYTQTKLYERYTVNYSNNERQGKYQQFSEDGHLIFDANYNNGKLHGQAITYVDLIYYCDGKPIKIENFNNDIKHGSQKTYRCFEGNYKGLISENIYNNGEIVRTVEFYDDGKKKCDLQINGICTRWYENGQKTTDYSMVNGAENGTLTAWYENGQIMHKGIYKEGVLNGTWNYYYPDGKLKKTDEHDFSNYSKKSTEYYQDGKLKMEKIPLEKKWSYKILNYDSLTGGKNSEKLYELINDNNDIMLVKNGKSIEFFDNGQVKSEIEFCYGKRCGTYIEYFNNGTSKAKGQYKDNYKVGKWNSWFENEQMESEGNFSESKFYIGKEIGTWIYWYSNGNKESEINYAQSDSPPYNSFKEGDSKTYYSNGKIKSEGKYKNGYETELWLFYTESGELDYAEDEYKDEPYSTGRKKKTKDQLDNEKARSDYKENSKLISQKFERANELYEVTISQVDNPNNWMAPKVTVFTPNKKKNLYNAFLTLDNHLSSKLSDSKPMAENLEISNDRIKLLNKISELSGSDTKEIEKALKKENDPEKIKRILGL